MTKQEVSDFKGGPMPESARIKMQERMQAAGQKGGGAPVPGGPGVPPPGPAGAPTAPK